MSTKIIKVDNSYKTIKAGGAIVFDGAATVTLAPCGGRVRWGRGL